MYKGIKNKNVAISCIENEIYEILIKEVEH